MPRIDFTRKHTAELVVRALTTRLDIPAYVTERHDIAVNGLKISLIYCRFNLNILKNN
jgi:hypothetical protein